MFDEAVSEKFKDFKVMSMFAFLKCLTKIDYH